VGVVMRRAVKKPAPAPAHKIHLPAWIGAPLWWCAGFARRNWKPAAWLASVLVAFYTPYVLHVHSHYLDDRRCDRINYAAQVAYQYGCAGRECSPDVVQYERQIMEMYGAMMQGCHVPAPMRPDEALSMLLSVGDNVLKGLSETKSIAVEPEKDGVTIVAEAS